MEPCLQCIKEEVKDDDIILDEKDPLQGLLLNSILPSTTEVSPNFESVVVKNEIKIEEYYDDDTPNDDELEMIEEPDENVETEIVTTEIKKMPQQSTSALPRACTKNETLFSDKSKKYGKHKCCQICSERLPRVHMEHYERTHKGYSYKCVVCCDKLFKKKKEFDRHVNRAKGIRPHQCSKCSANFLCNRDLITHRYMKHSRACNEEIKFSDKLKKYERQKFCQICSERLPRVHMEHYEKTHNGYSYKCAVCCEQLFKTRQEFETHVNRAKGIEPYQCSKCPLKFISSIDLQTHNYRKHPKALAEEIILKCKYCPKIFTKRTIWNAHVYQHTSSYLKDCKICGQVFTNSSGYNRHQLSHMERQKCLECSKSFTNKYILETHIRTIHRGERSDGGVCQICAKTITTLQGLKRHLETHAAQEEVKEVKKVAEDGISRPFQCDICERRFIHKFHLNEHKKLKHFKINVLPRNNESKIPKKSFPCPICKKEFSRRQILDQHSAMHSDENKYECKICFAKFSYYSALFTHMKSKTVHTTYTCTTCGDEFVGKKNYKAHLLVHIK